MDLPELSGVGRGRGRGGGVPVLPSGMWDSLNGTSEKKTYEDLPLDRTEMPSNDSNDNDRAEYVPTGFGRGRGSSGHDGGGRGGGRGRGDGRGRGGLNRDMKGTDWECPSCTNVNWSWRSTCNKCNTGKPTSVVAADEHRDGAGGGFNERQDRASFAAVEIDEDGFDDFGRRVKKLRRADKQAKEEAALNRLSEKYKHLLPVTLMEIDSSSNTLSQSVEKEKSTETDEKDRGRERDESNRHTDRRYDDVEVVPSRGQHTTRGKESSHARHRDRSNEHTAHRGGSSSGRGDRPSGGENYRDGGGDAKRPCRESENDGNHYHRSSRDGERSNRDGERTSKDMDRDRSDHNHRDRSRDRSSRHGGGGGERDLGRHNDDDRGGGERGGNDRYNRR